MDLNGLKYLVVGAGFYGSVVAEHIARVLGEKVLVLDSRPHLGGNSFSEFDEETGIEVHKYGSHIFHTSNQRVIDYISRFSRFNTYRHRVLTKYKSKTYSMPINLMTINSFFGTDLTPLEARAFLATQISKEVFHEPQNLEEKAISLIGRPLYEAFVQGYTQKQWGMDPRLLPSNIITRLPVRYDYNDRYFSDSFEGLPVDGYAKVFERILADKKIEVLLNTDYFEIQNRIPKDCLVIYSGAIDRFFNYKYGRLNWRTTDFVNETLVTADFQGTSVVNYADLTVPYTRIHEFKHFHPERQHTSGKTIISKEFSRSANQNDTPYYPVNTMKDKELFELYKTESQTLKNYIFGGRLGNYVYVDMHQVIAMAMNTFENSIMKRLS